MSLNRLPLLAFLLVGARATAHGQGSSPHPHPSDIVNRLRPAVRLADRPDTAFSLVDRMKYYHVPGLSIAVVDNFRIVYAAGFGVTEFGGMTAVDTNTLFLAGSISKPVFTTGALQLVEQGKLNLDEEVNQSLTSWKLPASRFTETEKVTLRRLLTHSAGLTVWGFPGYQRGTPVPTVPQLLDSLGPTNTPPVRNDTFPGARWRYSGGGITIAQLMATDVTGESFPALMKRLVLDRVGMVHSTYENPLPVSRDREAASGHEQFDTPVPGRYHVYPEMAAAGLWTTAPDLARWAVALTRAYNGDSRSILSPAMAGQMISQQVQVSPSATDYWGLGVTVSGQGDSISFSHGGRDEGFVASMVMWPRRGRGLFVLTNGVSGSLLNEISRAFADRYGLGGPPRSTHQAIAMDSSSLAPFTGRYELVFPSQRDTLRLDLTASPNMLRMWDPSLQRVRYLFPEGGDVFFDFDGGPRFTFERENGQIRALVLGQGANRRMARRVTP